jgi:hypothetical protein
MEKISFDNGVREFCINGRGVLRFNPCDPNVYLRFSQAEEKIRDVEKQLQTRAGNGEGDATLLYEADRQLKQILNWVFGPGNDFEEIAGNVNLLAAAKNGCTVVDNLFSALEPVLKTGAEESVRQQVKTAKMAAKQRRDTQR